MKKVKLLAVAAVFSMFSVACGDVKEAVDDGADRIALESQQGRLTEDMIKGNNPDLRNVTENLVLPKQLDSGVSVSWQVKKNDEVVTDSSVDAETGEVSRPLTGDEELTLVATLERGGNSITRTFNVVVKQQDLLP